MKQLNLKKGLPYGILLLIFLLLPLVLNTSYWIGVLIMVLYKVVGSVSLRTISLSGTLTFAHGAFIALGAYCGGILAKSLALPPVVTILAGGLFAMVVSVITGLPFVRLKGMYYSMASMFMGVTVAYIIKAMKITGGYHGLTRIPKLLQNDIACYYVFLAITVVLLIDSTGLSSPGSVPRCGAVPVLRMWRPPSASTPRSIGCWPWVWAASAPELWARPMVFTPRCSAPPTMI